MNRTPLKEVTTISLGLTGLNTVFSTELTQNITRLVPAWYDQCSVAILVKRTAVQTDEYQPLLPVMKVKSGSLRDEDEEDRNC